MKKQEISLLEELKKKTEKRWYEVYFCVKVNCYVTSLFPEETPYDPTSLSKIKRAISQRSLPSLGRCIARCIALLSQKLSCNPTDCSPPGSSVHAFLQARIMEWVTMPSSRGSFQPRNQTQVSHTAGRFFTFRATREAQINTKREDMECIYYITGKC